MPVKYEIDVLEMVLYIVCQYQKYVWALLTSTADSCVTLKCINLHGIMNNHGLGNLNRIMSQGGVNVHEIMNN